MTAQDGTGLQHLKIWPSLSDCSPGGVNFEAAPFKLTRELLEVMDSNSEGRPSELFDYFKARVHIFLMSLLSYDISLRAQNNSD